MTRKATYQHTATIHVWPGGKSYTYRGDPEGDKNQRSLRGGHRAGNYGGKQDIPAWRKGTPAEWAAIVREMRAARIADREVYCCDSGLVTDLINGAAGDSEVSQAFTDEEAIRNLYADPSEWQLDECRKYAEDYGIELPTTTRQTCCHHCQLDIEGDIFDEGWRDRGGNTHCRLEDEDETREQRHAQAEDDNDTEQAEWLDAAREACREHALDNPSEVFEWWRVSEWLCGKLHEIGEVTIDNGLGCWWGRTTTGQAFIMDGVLQRVADHLFASADAAARAERLVVKP